MVITSAQVVEASETVTDNSRLQDYPHPDDHTTRSTFTPRFKPFTVLRICNVNFPLETREISYLKLVFIFTDVCTQAA